MAAATTSPMTVSWIRSGEPSILVAAAVYGLSTTLSVIALHHVQPVDLAVVELAGASIVLLAAAVLTLRLQRRLAERLRPRAAVALIVGFSGCALIAVRGGDHDPGHSATIGNLLVLASVVVAAIFLVAARRFARESDSLSASAWQVTGGVNPTGWAVSLAVLLCGAVATAAFNRGIGIVAAARAGQLLNLTPAVGLLTAFALLGERPMAWQLVGGVGIVLGVALVLRTEPEPSHTTTITR